MKHFRNLFRFKSKDINNVDVLEKPKDLENSPDLFLSNAIDLMIHEDVYSAEKLLFDEAEFILSKPIGYDQEKYERLKSMSELGFKNAEEVKLFNSIEFERNKMEERRELIREYRMEYPFQRFIDIEAVKNICGKYNLLLTKVEDYIAEIPEKNQKEIVNFRVKNKHTRNPREVDSWLLDRHYYTHDENAFIEYQNKKVKGKHLLIIAPEHKLNTQNKEREGFILKIKDPIVLQPVNGGYLIVSSWGLEADDEMVINSNIN
jgi:hypothetical protein